MANTYKTLELLPAYGRVYHSANSALADWKQGKDFRLYNGGMFGPYCSIRDLDQFKKMGYTHVHLIWDIGFNSETFRI